MLQTTLKGTSPTPQRLASPAARSADALSSTEVSKLFKLSLSNRLMQTVLAGGSRLSPAGTAELAYHLWRRPRRRKSKPNVLMQQGEPLEVYHDGRFLHARWWGKGNGGPKAVLVHGWESQIGRMLPFVEPLLLMGWQVIALDGPAHGRSRQLLTDVFDFGAGIKSLLIEIRGADAMIAHSYGAAAALFMLSSHRHLAPERLVCLAPMVHMGIHLSIFNALTGIRPAVASRLEQKVESRFGVRCRDWHVLDIPQRFDRPGLIVHDQDDQVVDPKWGRRLQENWPGSALISTQGLSHNRILRDPSVIKHAVHFCNA